MSIRCFALVRATLVAVLCVALMEVQAAAQTASPDTSLKEVQIGASAFSIGNPVPSWVDLVEMPQADKSEPVLLRLADTQYSIGSTYTVYVRRAIMVNDPGSLSALGQLAIRFVPQYQRVQLHTIQIVRGSETLDRTSSSTVRFLQREMGLEQGMYSGEVTASILVEDLRVGDTLVMAYSSQGHNPVFGDKFFDTVGWDQGPKTGLRRVSLSFSDKRKISWRLLSEGQVKPISPTESTRDGIRKLVFEEKSIPRLNSEVSTPPNYLAARLLQFSEFTGWDEVAAWANSLFETRSTSDEALRAVVERIRAKSTPEERVSEALTFVQSEIRYFSVSLGENSHRPSQPDAVLKRRYGDCKDKSLMLISLLREIGITGKAVLLQSQPRYVLSKTLPTPEYFDHAIVQVTLDGKSYFLDPTRMGQYGRLARLGQAHEASEILIVSPDTRQISIIASANARELSLDEVFETASLPAFGKDAEMQTRQVWRGLLAERVRLLYEQYPRDMVVKSVADALQSRYPGTTMVGEPDITDDRINNVVSITANYKVPKLTGEQGSYVFVRFAPTNILGVLTAPSSAARATPLFLPGYPLHAKYSFEIKFPNEIRVVADPRVQTVQNRQLAFTSTSAFRGNVAKHTIELRLLSDRVEPAQLAKYSEDLRSIGNTSTAVVLLKQWLKPVAGKVEIKKDFAQLLRDRQQETVTKTTESIKSGKLSGNDLAGAYCARSSAHANLGQAQEALADANEAVKLSESSALHCRAYAHFNSGEFEKSIADYSRAIVLGSTDAKSFYQRGIAKFYAGKLDAALEDFTRASDGADREAQALSDLWLAWTSLRLGKPLPEAVVERSASQARDWPRPALAVMTGRLAPENMLKGIAAKTGDDRTMGTAEGYFYLGQYYLAQGDVAKAREFFEKTRELKVIIYTEHTAAGFELQRLGSAIESGAITKRAPADVKDAKKIPAKAKPSKSWLDQIFKQ